MEEKRHLDKIEYWAEGYDDFEINEFEHFIDPIKIRHCAECFDSNGQVGVKVDGEEIIPAIYKKIRLIKYESVDAHFFAIVYGVVSSGNGGWGILSDKNEVILDCLYDNIFWFKDGKSITSTIKLIKDNKYYALNLSRRGQLIEIDNYSYIGSFRAYKAFVYNPRIRENKIKEYLKENNLEPRQYAIVKKNGKYGILLDDSTVLVEPINFVELSDFAVARKDDDPMIYAEAKTEDGFYVVIDARGFYWGQVPPCYMSVIKFNTSRFIVKDSNKKWGVIDSANNAICDFYFDEYIHGNLPPYAKRNERYAIFGCKKGKVIINMETGEEASNYYDCLLWLDDSDYCLAGKAAKYGVIKDDGETVLHCIYDKIYNAYLVNGCVNSKDVVFNGTHGKLVNNVFFPDVAKNLGKNDVYNDKDVHDTYPKYEKFSGSYVQDEAGWSDDDIDTVLEGDPSAYWNID